MLGRKTGNLALNPGTLPSESYPPSHPVEQVSWGDAVAFCARLSELAEEKRQGWIYRLPTEIEWEYSCRAGTSTDWCFGNAEDDSALLKEYAWYDGITGKPGKRKTRPVGQLKPNAWGLYDMHGNAFEWCVVEFDSGYETVQRGGCSGRNYSRCFSWARSSYGKINHGWHTGFRVVRVRSE